MGYAKDDNLTFEYSSFRDKYQNAYQVKWCRRLFKTYMYIDYDWIYIGTALNKDSAISISEQYAMSFQKHSFSNYFGGEFF